MLTGSLLGVFVVAKLAVLVDRDVDWSSWTLFAYFWQDICAAALFGAAEWLATGDRTRVLVRASYAGIALYAALNIPIMLVLTTPLTWPMLRATSGTLADSILLYATPPNIALVLLTLAAAVLLPLAIARLVRLAAYRLSAVVAIVAAVGWAASPRVDTLGLHRNVLFALVGSGVPHVAASAAGPSSAAADVESWSSPPFEPPATDDHTHLRGAARDKNVVLVTLESTAASYLRLYGGADDITPRLDRLADSGIVFERAYAAYPESIKGLFSVLCSMYPAFDTVPEDYERVRCRSFASVAADAGYRTALIHSGRFAYLGMESIIRNRGFHVLEDAADIGGQRESSFGVDEPSTVARALAWIDALPQGQRFLLNYLPIAGHHPYEAPGQGPFADHDEVGRYKNAVHYADRALGSLIDGIRARGLERDTIWIVIGDHGEAFGQHDGNYGHTFFLYDENVRVPFVIAAPGAFPEAQRSRTPVSLVDVAPTIADLIGVEVPAEYQGRSALASSPRMTLFFTDYSLGFVGLRDGRWKFIAELASGRARLFDLQADPAERDDVAAHHEERVADYERTLRTWSAAQKALITAPERCQGSKVPRF